LRISKVIFYDEPAVPEIRLDSLVCFAEDTVGIHAEKRGPILSRGGPDIQSQMAASRVLRLDAPFARRVPTPEEIRAEEAYAGTAGGPDTACYDGIQLQGIFAQLIPREEAVLDILHVIFTDRLTCTYDDTDRRYHGRAMIGSNPAIISTTGMIEAPAKPRGYYVDLIAGTGDEEGVRRQYAGEFLEYHDKRLAAVAEGYFLQAMLYYVSGEPFCDSRDCRAFNAHWQRDLLHSQIGEGRLCERHQRILHSVKNLN